MGLFSLRDAPPRTNRGTDRRWLDRLHRITSSPWTICLVLGSSILTVVSVPIDSISSSLADLSRRYGTQIVRAADEHAMVPTRCFFPQSRYGDQREGAAESADRVMIDLTRKETFVPLRVNADPEDIELTHIQVKSLPSPHSLVPREGVVQYGTPVDIVLQEPDGVRIRLSLVTREDAPTLRISPQVVLRGGETIELTQNRITRSARSFQRRVKYLHQRLSALAAARRRLQTWLLTPGNKPLDAVKAARMRLKLLEQEIRAQQQELPLVQNQCLALQQIATFADELHQQAEIRFTVRSRRNGR